MTLVQNKVKLNLDAAFKDLMCLKIKVTVLVFSVEPFFFLVNVLSASLVPVK